jgi:hypothetical protein
MVEVPTRRSPFTEWFKNELGLLDRDLKSLKSLSSLIFNLLLIPKSIKTTDSKSL